MFLLFLLLKATKFDLVTHRWQELPDSLTNKVARESNQTRIADTTLKDLKHYVQCKTAKNWQTRWQKHKGAAKNMIQVVNPNKKHILKGW